MTSKKRKLLAGTAYDPLFRKPDRETFTINRSTNAFDTVRNMEQLAYRFVGDTRELAPLLEKDTVYATCRAIWQFCIDHIQYEPDHPEIEQLRSPARSWADRIEGVDCDCYSLFISTLLLNLGIPHRFRITDYGDGWQHVYVVGLDGTAPIVIDPVVDRFNYEPPYVAHRDFSIMELQLLNGIPQMNNYPTYDPTANQRALAHRMTMNQIADATTTIPRPAHNFLRGMGSTPAVAPAESAGFLAKTKSWVQQNPVSTAGLIVGGTLVTIGIVKYVKGKKKTSKSRSRSLNGLEGRAKRKTSSRKRKSNGTFI